MSRYYLFFLCFLLAKTSFSQVPGFSQIPVYGEVPVHSDVPGYQGKRFFAEIGTSFWYNSYNPRANNQGPERFDLINRDSKFTLQEHYFLSLSYVLSRKIVCSMEYEYSKTGLVIRDRGKLLTPSDYGAVTPSRMFYGFVDMHQLFYNLYAHKTSFSFSHHFKPKRNLAPLGFYIKYGVDLIFAKGVLLDQKVLYGHDSDFNDNKPSKEFTNPVGINADAIIPVLGMHWGIGYRAIVANRIILKGAIQSTIIPQVFPSSRSRISQVEKEEGYVDRNNINYINRVHERVQMHYYLNIVIGIGVLIY